MDQKKSLALPVRMAVFVLGALAILVLCSFKALPASADGSAFVRVVHASPDAGAVDVYVDGGKLLSNFQFGTVTGYVPLSAGSHKIQVVPAGQPVSAAVITQTVSVNAGVPYTVAAIGTKASGFSVAAFADNNLLSGNIAKVRVYHLSPDAGPVNVAVGNNTVISGLTYKNASGYLSVAPGSYTFNVTATQANATVSVGATLKAGTVTSVFAIGLLKGTPKLQFVAAQVPGVPGMPGTGSDPNAVPDNSQYNSQLPTPFVLGTLAVLVIGAGLLVRSLAVARHRVKDRS